MLPYVFVIDHPLSVQTAKNTQTLRIEGNEIFAEGAERIELYDVSGCKLDSITGDRISVSSLDGVVIAKGYFSNGETGHAKFIVR